MSRRASTYAVVVLAVAAAIGLRWWLLASPAGRVDADEATVGLMARSILDGHRPVFFWGQSYGGTAEPALVAVLFAIAGTSGAALKAIPLALHALAALVLWRVARRVADAHVAPVAAALFLLYPPAFVWWSTKERGFYWVGLVFALVALLTALRLAKHAGDRPARRDLLGLGVATGLAWWTSPQTMFLVAPVLVWVTVGARARVLAYWPAAVAAAVAALPWLIWNAGHGWSSLHQPAVPVPSSYAGRVRLFFARTLPVMLGVRRPFTGSWLWSGAGVVLYAAALAAFAVAAIRHARDPQRASATTLLFGIALVYPLLFALPATSYYADEPRYALMLSPVVVLLVARTLTTAPRQALTLAVAVALAATTVAFTRDFARDTPARLDLAAPPLGALTRTLDRLHVDHAYADYWIAAPLMLRTRERIVVSAPDAPRSPSIAAEVAAARPAVYIVFRDRPRDRALGRTLPVPYRRVTTDRFAIYVLARPVPPAVLARVWSLPSP